MKTIKDLKIDVKEFLESVDVESTTFNPRDYTRGELMIISNTRFLWNLIQETERKTREVKTSRRNLS